MVKCWKNFLKEIVKNKSLILAIIITILVVSLHFEGAKRRTDLVASLQMLKKELIFVKK
jgi:hypothetical protein